MFVGALLGASTLEAQPANGPRQFPPGSIRSHTDLPPGRLRSHLERLPQAAQQRATAWLNSFHFTEHDLDALQLDSVGGVYYIDKFEGAPATEQSAEPVTAQASLPSKPLPQALVFHSRPGAPNVLYLNFEGESVTGTQWNTELGRSTITALPFSTDLDYSTFNDAEQTAIKRMWERVSEDYAPFNVDVTTERPNVLNSRTAEAVITRNTDATGADNPASDAGGVAYVNVFGSYSFSKMRPAWIYHNNLANSESYTAEAIAHELGHNLGLSHDGTSTQDYYGGHGTGETSWGPIMGTGYGRNVSQWCKGEYYLADNMQDDLAIIAGKLGYMADDHSNSISSATPLTITSGTNVLATTPEDDPTGSSAENKGIIERNDDVDVFSFTTGSGLVSLHANPWVSPFGTRGGNLDVVLELLDSSGTLLLSNNPAASTGAAIETNLPAGKYFLQVSGTGFGSPMGSSPTGYTVYGSLGEYFITGFVAPLAQVPPNPTPQPILTIERGLNGPVLSWTSTPGLFYTVLQSTDPRAGFAPVSGAISLPSSTNTVQIDSAAATGQLFFKLQVSAP